MKPKSALPKQIIFIAFLLVIIYSTLQYIQIGRHNQHLKKDLHEINHVRYGLLNVDEWTDKLAEIVSAKINEFELTPDNREEIQESVEDVLYALIDEVEELMKVRTSGQFSGIKKWVAGFAIDVDQMRDNVPSFANTVIEELNKPETKNALKVYLLDKLDDFSESTYNKDKMELLAKLLQQYGCESRENCLQELEMRIEECNTKILRYTFLIPWMILSIYLIVFLPKIPLKEFDVVVVLLSTFCLLLSGITTPMIELEAKIDLMYFQLVGEEIIFKNQIFFFQSKSITDVVRLMIKEGSVQMIFVGILIFTFSVVFPLTKLICSYLYYVNRLDMRENKVIKFFVLKSGKWSMADVMVVAMFMAFIGFNGVVSSQLNRLSEVAKPIEILTTNGTQLVSGFYLFLLFSISSLLLSSMLIKRASEN